MLTRYDGNIHDPFMMFAVVPSGAASLKEAAEFITQRW